jgi:hypothetical protein
MKQTILAVFLFTALVAGCNKKKGEATGESPVATKPATGSSAPVETQPATDTKPTPPPPAPLPPGAPPVTVKSLDKFQEDDMGEKLRAFELTNRGSSVVTHLQFYVWYYDKDKQPLTDKPSAQSYPEQLGIKPGETKVLMLGFAEGQEPAGTAFVEAPLTEVDFADGTSWKNDKDGYPDRPMGGTP